MTRRSKEAYISQMLKTALYWKQKADREYAYAKNSGEGYHYGNAKKAYAKEKEYKERARKAEQNGY